MDAQRDGNTAETALPVREVSRRLGDYIARLNRIWVEGQIVSNKQYGNTYYITFRDPDADMSITAVAAASIVEACEPPLAEGSRVVMHAAMEWWTKKGEIRARAHAIRPVGIGDLLARIEQLRRQLAAEDLFNAERKRPLPFLPRRVGLITGRDTDALKDVVVNARRRWPSTAFAVREIQLQTKDTPLQAIAAMRELEQLADVDVIVFARGGGSFEDLLPWSDEGLVRAVVKCLKPVVSAIGHENDRPILDDAADVRASTPTDAARRIVPDLQEESARAGRSISRLRDLRQSWLQLEQRHINAAVAVLRANSPRGIVKSQQQRLTHTRSRLSHLLQLRLQREDAQLRQQTAALAALSPYQVLARGYAVATKPDGTVIKRAAEIKAGAAFDVRLHEGVLPAVRREDKE